MLRGANSPKKMTKMASEDEVKNLSKKAASKDKDVPWSSCWLKSSKKDAEMGMIFMCNSETKEDCYHYNVLGLPANKRELVGNVYKGMVLFLYDVDLKLMYGIYRAAGPGGYNIEPKAFNSQFPSQVRFRVLDDCKPLAEEIFRKAIQKNYYTRTKFDCKLTSKQVKDLCKLFTAASRSPFKKLGRHISYERDVIAYQLPCFIQRATSHSFDHNSEVNTHRRRPSAEAVDDSYRHDWREESWDFNQHRYYRQEPVLESRTSYRRDEVNDYDALRPLDFSPRWGDGTRNRRSYDDHYDSYRERLYRDRDYGAISEEYRPVYHSPEYHYGPRSRVKYYSTSRPVLEYRDADLSPEYRSSPGMCRYRC